MPRDLDPVFQHLRRVLRQHARQLVPKDDRPGCFTLACRAPSAAKRQPWLAAVMTNKAYVSYHLMPVYGCPALLQGISPALRARMQGKACFNFREIDPALFRELGELTTRSFKAFKAAGFMA